MFNTAEYVRKLLNEQTKNGQTQLQYDECLTVVGHFPRLMTFCHFHAPKSWSLLHLLTWFFLFCKKLSDEQLWPWVLCFFNYSGKETEFFPVLKNGIFQQFSRSAVFPPSLYKKISMVSGLSLNSWQNKKKSS